MHEFDGDDNALQAKLAVAAAMMVAMHAAVAKLRAQAYNARRGRLTRKDLGPLDESNPSAWDKVWRAQQDRSECLECA